MSATGFVDALARATIGATFNFYRDGDGDGDGDGAERRRARLSAYLESRKEARLLLVGEAAGYRGARVSGIPMTCERQLSGSGPSEATATIVHRALGELGVADNVLLWNVVPTHPHLRGRPETNRRPTRLEVETSRPYLAALAEGRRIVPLGRVAHATVGGEYVRHPAHGGAAAFLEGLRRIVARDAGGNGGAMDKSTIRESAEAHGRAVVEREYERASESLTDEVKATAGQVMKELPRPVTSSEVVRVERAGDDEWVAYIRYSGEAGAAVVASRWAEQGDRPRIVELTVVERT